VFAFMQRSRRYEARIIANARLPYSSLFASR